MKIFFKHTAIVFTIVSLTACLEVEDNNDELVGVLQQQNEILLAENAAQQSEKSVTLTGKIKNITTDSLGVNPTIKIKIGNDWSDPSAISDDGSFALDLLPLNSDYTLVVTSEDASFVDRAYFGTTHEGSLGVSFQDIGLLNVSAGELVSLSVLDSQTNENILALELYASSRVIQSNRVGIVNDYEAYFHTSTYNETTNQYDIVLPKDILLDIYASLDLDSDGNDDYRVEGSSYSTYMLVRASNIDTQSIVYLIDQKTVEQIIEFRVSVLDKESNVIKDVSLTIDDQINDKVLSEFDEATQQYVLTANLVSTLKILSPAFTTEDNSYSSGYISISKYNEKLQVQTYVYDQYGRSTYSSYSLPMDTEIVDIVFQPREVSGSEDIELIYKSSNLHADNTSYKAFYSQSITLNDDSIELKQKNVLAVTRGNDSLDDLVLSGTTLVTYKDVDIAVNAELSLNNTQLSVEPIATLQGDYQYQYIVNEVMDTNTGVLVNISNDDSAVFEVELSNNDIFDINTLKLDNNNYYNNGLIIKAENTAGQASNYSYRSSSVNLVIPSVALTQLKSLTIQKMIVTNQGISANNVNSWHIIDNGQFNYISSNYALSTAENEVITYENYNSYSLVRGLNIADGKVYLVGMSEYLYDDTNASENSITFEYSFETVDGSISTGSLTLAVQ